jgi:hypothetical protein
LDNQVFRLAEEEISGRDLQKPFGELKQLTPFKMTNAKSKT